MTYTKTQWVNNVTALNAANMNKIENGIEAVTDLATTNETNIGTLANLTTEDKSTLVKAINEVNAGVSDADTSIAQLDTNKVDKVNTTGELAAYVHNGTTQGVKVVSNTPGQGQLPMYDSSSRIKTNTPSANNDCANKSYVDNATGPYTDEEIDEILEIS